jgi:hypothetical protein
LEPHEFISREDFDALDERARTAYVSRFAVALGPIFNDNAGEVDASTKLDYIKHYFDVMEWMLPPDEYDKQVRTPLWETAWENAEEIRASVAGAATGTDLDDDERAHAEQLLQSVQAMVEHKRGLDELPDQ